MTATLFLTDTSVGLRCLCGGRVYTRDDLIRFAHEQGAPDEVGQWEALWCSLMGPFDLYCSDDDEVLLDTETWRVRGLTVPVHDRDEAWGWDPDFGPPMEIAT